MSQSKTEHDTPTPQSPNPNAGLTIGLILREAREKKGYSIKKISHHTKISTSILERLEKDMLESLPSRTYVNGFVKAYAQVVDLDLNQCLAVLEQTYMVKNNSPLDTVHKAQVFVGKEIQNPHAQTSLLVTVSIIVVLAVLGFIINRDSSKQAPKEIAVKTHELNESTPLKDPLPTSAENTNSAKSNEKVAETPSMGTSPTTLTLAPDNNKLLEIDTTPTPIITNTNLLDTKAPLVEKTAPIVPVVEKTIAVKEIKAAAPVTVVPATTTAAATEEKKDDKPEIELKPMPSNLYSQVSDDVSKQSLSTYVPANMQASVVDGRQNVFIAAVSDSTWLTYKKDDEEVKKFVLEKGKNILIRGEEIRIFLGNVNATKIFLNNNLLDVSSKSGVKSLVFPQESSGKYRLPLFIYKETGQVVPSSEL